MLYVRKNVKFIVRKKPFKYLNMKFLYPAYLLLVFPLLLHAKVGDKPKLPYNNFTPDNRPIEFIENKGQWGNSFLFNAETGKGSVYLLKDGFTYLIGDPSNTDNMEAYHHGAIRTCPPLKFHSYRMTFLNAATPQISGNRMEDFYCNYFLGNDPSKWKTGIHPYLGIDYKQLYNGIDMHISSEKGNVKYEFVVSPGTDVNQLRMLYKGQTSIKIKKNNLVIETTIGDVLEMKPYVYQYINDSRVEVPCEYNLSDNIVSYSFPNGYDHTKPLVIDPTVVFATFSGSTSDNWGFTATYDEHGNFYNGGIVHPIISSDTFITTPGAFQTTFQGGDGTTGSLYADDIGIVKYNSSGSTRIWATYIGGSSNEQPHSMIVDAQDNLVIAGRSYSSNFPTTSGAYDQSYNGSGDIVVVKLKNDGSTLLASTFIGGNAEDGTNFDPQEFVFGGLKHNYGDDARSEVILDRLGNVYVTASSQSTNFPTTSTAIKSSIGGAQDGVVFKMNPSLSTLIWSTYIGGGGDDAGYVLALDTAQTHLYVAGGTSSSNFHTTGGTLHPTYLGGIDGYILKFLNGSTYALQKETFIGSTTATDDDQVYGIQVDFNNMVYVMGQSLGGHFAVSSGVYSNANSTQFIQKLDSNLSTAIFSTVYGTGDATHTDISPVAFLVDTCQNIYISGWGGVLVTGAGFPASTGSTTGLPVTTDAAQKTTDGHDFYFICLSRDATSLLYATFMGGTGATGEHVDGGTSRFDKYGIVYQAICGGCGGSSSFPTTTGAWSTINRSSNCNEIALKIAFELGNVVAKAQAYPSTTGCIPFTVNFGDSSINAKTYSWDFGDGGTDTAKYPIHTFTTVGTFTVRLVINNPKACKVLDTAYLTIKTDTNYVRPSFITTVQDSCDPYIASFSNTSSYSHTPGASAFTKFKWDFGDGNTYNGFNPPTHTYSGSGTYKVLLIMTDSTACNSPDTISRTVNMNSKTVAAKFYSPDSVCKNATVKFDDSSSNGASYSWDFGDGNTSTSATGEHIFDTSGVFTVTYIVSNPATCNGSDTFIKQIVVLDLPIADFTFSPAVPQTNIPTSFTNLSVNATRYAWVFGDGTVSGEVNPVHQFKRSGNYNVCLYARNKSNCPSSLCRLVGADVKPLVDLPTGFSPNGDGSNDILYVRGSGIVTMNLQIFNRWGILIFESNDQSIGWDGKFNGQEQPMEAYAYVLHVTFIDDTKVVKKGNVTLLR